MYVFRAFACTRYIRRISCLPLKGLVDVSCYKETSLCTIRDAMCVVIRNRKEGTPTGWVPFRESLIVILGGSD